MNEELTSSELGKLLGVSQRRVNQLADEEVIQKLGRNKFDGPDCVKRYIDFRVDQAREESSNASESEVENQIEQQKLEKLRLEVSKARRNESIEKGESDTRPNISRAYVRGLKEVRAHVEKFVNTMKARNKRLTASESEQIDRDLAEMFNRVADYVAK